MKMAALPDAPTIIYDIEDDSARCTIEDFDRELRLSTVTFGLAALALSREYSLAAGLEPSHSSLPSTVTEVDAEITLAKEKIESYLKTRVDKYIEYDPDTEITITKDVFFVTMLARQKMRSSEKPVAMAPDVRVNVKAENLRDALRAHRIAVYAGRVAAYGVTIKQFMAEGHDLPQSA